MSDVTASRQITSAEELARWLAASRTTPAELFARSSVGKAHATPANGTPDQQIITLQNSGTVSVVKWIDLADLVSWSAPAETTATPLEAGLGAAMKAVADGFRRETWRAGSADLPLNGLPLLVGFKLPGVAVYLRSKRSGAEVTARTTVTVSNSGVGPGLLRASFDLTMSHGVRQVEYVEGFLRAGAGAALGRSVVVHCRRTTATGKSRFGPVVLEMGLYRAPTLSTVTTDA